MRNILYGIGIILTVGLGHPAWAQEVRATCDTLTLDFGYPLLEAQDDLTFVDENENGQIDPGEGCAIVFTLANRSKYAAQTVYIKPNELNGITGLMVPQEVKVGNIPPEGSRRVEVAILARDSLQAGTASFSFGVFEGDDAGQSNTTIVYSMPVNLEPKAEKEDENVDESEQGPR